RGDDKPFTLGDVLVGGPALGAPGQWNGVNFSYVSDDLPDEFSKVKGGSIVNHAEFRYATNAIIASGQPRHSPFAADFVDPEGPARGGTAQSQAANPTNINTGGLPVIGNLGFSGPGDLGSGGGNSATS